MKIEIFKDNRGQWRWRLVEIPESAMPSVLLRSHKGFDRIILAQQDIDYVYKALGKARKRPREKV